MPVSDSILKAIGGNKYVVVVDSQVNIQHFEVIRPCMGLLIRMEKIDGVYVKVEYEDKNFKRQSLISEIKLTDYMCIAQRLNNNVLVHEVEVDDPSTPDPNDTNPWFQFILPFSFNGDLDLSRDNKLIVQMSQKTSSPEAIKATFEYYSVGRAGYPVSIEKERILQSEDNTARNFLGYDYCFFPSGVDFNYVQYEQAGFVGGSRQTTMEQAVYDAAVYDHKNDIELANGGVLFDTRQRSELTISHTNEDDIVIFKVDCVRASLSATSGTKTLPTGTVKSVGSLSQSTVSSIQKEAQKAVAKSLQNSLK